jgi:DNA-binding CsgD family transcriptional regulator
MKVPRQDALAMLARVGRADLIEEAKRDLPDPIDTDRGIDIERLLQYGLTRDQLMDRMGGSP